MPGGKRLQSLDRIGDAITADAYLTSGFREGELSAYLAPEIAVRNGRQISTGLGMTAKIDGCRPEQQRR